MFLDQQAESSTDTIHPITIEELLTVLETTPHQVHERREVAAVVTSLVASTFGTEAFPHGSWVNGFSSVHSDLDFHVPLPDADHATQVHAAGILAAALATEVQGAQGVRVISEARVPIMTAIVGGLKVDVSFNNPLVIPRTQILQMYSTFDPAVRALGILVKHWARLHRVSASENGYFSGYSWTLLVIFFLQREKLRNRQLSRGGSGPHVPITHDEFKLMASMVRKKQYRLKSRVTPHRLGHLVRRFFQFFAHEFQFQGELVCIRKPGAVRSKDDSGVAYRNFIASWSAWKWYHSWCIKDPCDEGNLKVLTGIQLGHTLATLRKAAIMLRTKSVESIFTADRSE